MMGSAGSVAQDGRCRAATCLPRQGAHRSSNASDASLHEKRTERMILTITAHAALDRVLFISEFVPAATMRTARSIEAVGGKGFDVSVALAGLGADTVALGFVAGPTGRQLLSLMDGYGIRHDVVEVEGDTRIAHVVVETTHGHRESHITTTGYAVSQAAIDRLVERYLAWLPSAQWVVMSGSLPPAAPPDLYATLITLAHSRGISVLADCAGEPARRAAAAQPAVLKLNRAELAATFGATAPTLVELTVCVQMLRAENGLTNVIVTAGSEGILAVTSAGIFLAGAPSQPVVNAAGAGDAVSAAIAWRLGRGDAWPEALRWAAASGAAATLTERTAEVRGDDVRRLYADAWVKRLP